MTKDNDSAFSFSNPFKDISSCTPDIQSGMKALFDVHRKNIQSMNTLQQITLESMQDVAEKQKTVFSKIMSQTTSLANDVASAENPEDKVANNLKALQSNCELFYKNMQDISETLKASGSEATTILRKRVAESVKEAREIATKQEQA